MRYIPLLVAIYILLTNTLIPRIRHRLTPNISWYYKGPKKDCLVRLIKESYVGYFTVEEFDTRENLMFGKKEACLKYLEENNYTKL